MRLSVIDQIKKLDLQKAALIEAARNEALSDVHKAIKTLKSLGHHFELVAKRSTAPETVQPKTLKTKSVVKKAKKRKGTRVGTRKPANVACPICSFKTNPPHDRRSHRFQENKKAFTQKELSTKGMEKIS